MLLLVECLVLSHVIWLVWVDANTAGCQLNIHRTRLKSFIISLLCVLVCSPFISRLPCHSGWCYHMQLLFCFAYKCPYKHSCFYCTLMHCLAYDTINQPIIRDHHLFRNGLDSYKSNFKCYLSLNTNIYSGGGGGGSIDLLWEQFHLNLSLDGLIMNFKARFINCGAGLCISDSPSTANQYASHLVLYGLSNTIQERS